MITCHRAPLLAAAVLAAVAAGGAAHAQPAPGVAPATDAQPTAAAVAVAQDAAEYRFAESMTFRLAASADVPIEDVVLRYVIGADGIRNRRIPSFTPGPRVEAVHDETLVRGQIPPASEIRWWWTVTTADGRVAETEPRSFVYLDQAFDWQSLDAPDVRVWWYDADRSFAEEIQARTREALDKLGDLIGSLPDRRIEIVAYQSQEDLRPALVDRGGTYETRLATLGARVATDILVLDAGTRGQDLYEVLTHELSHVVLNLHFDEEYIDAPLWLDEGLAMYVEGPLAPDEQAELDQAIESDTLMSVRSLTSFPGDASLVPLAYAESRDIVAFLIASGGEAKFRRFLDAIGDGASGPEQALEDVYGYDQLTLYQAYRAHHGLSEAATPSPDEIAAWQAERMQRTEGDGAEAPPPLGWPCGSAGLAVVGVALAAASRRRAAPVR